MAPDELERSAGVADVVGDAAEEPRPVDPEELLRARRRPDRRPDQRAAEIAVGVQGVRVRQIPPRIVGILVDGEPYLQAPNIRCLEALARVRATLTGFEPVLPT